MGDEYFLRPLLLTSCSSGLAGNIPNIDNKLETCAQYNSNEGGETMSPAIRIQIKRVLFAEAQNRRLHSAFGWI